MSRIGANPTLRTTAADFELLDENKDEDGRCWLYVQADGSIDDSDCCLISEAGQAEQLSSAETAVFGDRAGVATSAFADDEYGWICIEGTGSDITVNALADAALHAQLNSTGTAGALDDDGAAGRENVDGIVLISTNGGSTAAVQCILTRPTIGITNA